MLKAVRGRYKDGTVEFYEKPDVTEGNVIITFLDGEQTENVKLSEKGITRAEAGNFRNRLRALEEDWNVEGMDLFDRL